MQKRRETHLDASTGFSGTVHQRGKDSQKGPEIVEQKDSFDVASLARTILSSTPSFDFAPASA